MQFTEAGQFASTMKSVTARTIGWRFFELYPCDDVVITVRKLLTITVKMIKWKVALWADGQNRHFNINYLITRGTVSWEDSLRGLIFGIHILLPNSLHVCKDVIV